jgi:hypothetical protein
MNKDMKKEINEICRYIKENPDCCIDYVDNQNFIIYKKYQKNRIYDGQGKWDYDINDNGEDYIPIIVLIFQACVKKGIDISKIKITSC